MKNKIIITLNIFFLLLISIGSCESASMDRNPFKSWLPAIEKILTPPPVEKETVQPETQQQLTTTQEIAIIPPPMLEINGIVWNTKKPQAIINDQVVVIGDTIENSKIVDIRKDGVDVIFNEKLFTLPIQTTSAQSI